MLLAHGAAHRPAEHTERKGWDGWKGRKMGWKEGERSIQRRRKGTLPAGRLNHGSSQADGRKQLGERKGNRRDHG